MALDNFFVDNSPVLPCRNRGGCLASRSFQQSAAGDKTSVSDKCRPRSSPLPGQSHSHSEGRDERPSNGPALGGESWSVVDRLREQLGLVERRGSRERLSLDITEFCRYESRPHRAISPVVFLARAGAEHCSQMSVRFRSVHVLE